MYPQEGRGSVRVSNAIAAIAICLIGCATPYRPAGKTSGSGYSDQYLGDDIYLITVRLNAFTDKATAYEYFHRRAHEITRRRGYDRYEVIEMLEPDEHGVLWVGDKPVPMRAPRLQGRIKCLRDAPVASREDIKPASESDIVTGTAWPVKGGYVVTNDHVVHGKSYFYLLARNQKPLIAWVAVSDERNDLALLQVADPVDLPPAIELSVTSARLGEDVFTIGYPHPGLMGRLPKVTTGTVTSTAGLADDPRTYQISVPLQAGNSGGPLLNTRGQAVGVVSAKLNALYTLVATGDLPQNVNYAIKSAYLQILLDGSQPLGKVETLSGAEGAISEHAERIQDSIFLVVAAPYPLKTSELAPGSEDAPVAAGQPTTDRTDKQHKMPLISEDEVTFGALVDGLRQLQTYQADQLGEQRLILIERLLGISAESVESMRWGTSLAPPGHPKAGTTWYTIGHLFLNTSKLTTFTVDQYERIVGHIDR